jgi:hypothetical protein
MRTSLIPRPVAQPGAVLRLLLLAAGSRSSVGVDLGSGAIVRSHHPRMGPLEPFDVVESTVEAEDPLPERPETVRLVEPLHVVDRLAPRVAERWVRPLLHPRDRWLLGFAAPAKPFWDLNGTEPSVAVVSPLSPPVVRVEASGVFCYFPWHCHLHRVPIDDSRLVARLTAAARHPTGAIHQRDAFGFDPRRIVLALSAPYSGHCYKVAVGFLPAP